MGLNIIKPATRIAFSLILNKTSDLLLSPKTTLPTLLTAAGAPIYLAPLLVPIRESGALLPQALYAKLLSTNKHRHRPWRLGIILQFFSSMMILFAGFFVQGLLAGALIIVFLTTWSLSRALCSLTNKDIQGKHIEVGDRGKLIGGASSISALITMLIAIVSLFGASACLDQAQWLSTFVPNKVDNTKLFILGLLALLAQIICIFFMWPLKTLIVINQSSANTSNRPQESQGSVGFIFNSTAITRFIIMRSLFAHSALLAPLFSLAYGGDLLSALGYLILAQAGASLISSYVWGALSDKSALLCMQLGGLLALLASLALLSLMVFYSHFLENILWIISLFFILNVGHAGVRTGRKIYSLDIAKNHERTDFVAKTNTAVGSFILLAGFAYSGLMVFSLTLTLAVMSIGLLGGLASSFYVKKEK